MKQLISDGQKVAILLGSGFALVWIEATLALNVISLPVALGYHALERAVGGKVKTEPLTLESEKLYRSPNARFFIGNFRTREGNLVELTDTGDIPTGKFFGNSLYNAETGKTYSVKYLDGPISHKILKISNPN